MLSKVFLVGQGAWAYRLSAGASFLWLCSLVQCLRYLPLVVWFGCRFLFLLCGPFVLLSDSVFLLASVARVESCVVLGWAFLGFFTFGVSAGV